MKLLVLGSSGLVGRAIINQAMFLPWIDKIVGINRHNRYFYDDHPDTHLRYIECYGNLTLGADRLITQYKPDILLNAAGDGSPNGSKELWRRNVDVVLNLLESCVKAAYKVRFIQCSSLYVQTGATTLYTTSKRCAEHLVKSYTDRYPSIIDGRTVRFPAVAGAGARHGVVKAIIDKLLDNTSESLNLLTNSKKPLIYNNRLADALLEIAQQEKTPPTATICSEDTISVEEIAKHIMNKMDVIKPIEWSNESWVGDTDILYPASSYIPMGSSRLALELAVKDILDAN